jgi:phosphotransferase family enzyme
MIARTRLARACSDVPRVLPASVVSRSIRSAQITSTHTALIVLGAAGERPSAVVKMPLTGGAARSVAREGRMLARLHADDRLDGLRTLLPLRLAEGTVRDRSYAVDSGLAGGTPAGGRLSAAQRAAAAEAAALLHRATAGSVRVDDAVARRWIVEPAACLAARSGHPAARRRLRGFADDLADDLHGQLLPAGWIHGDYWPGNLLFDDRGEVEGIVDWDAAAPAEPPLHDLLHLLLYGRRLAGGAELGQVVRQQLLDDGWTAEERRIIRDGGAFSGLPERQALLLYWLRQTAAHARQQGSRASPRHQLWEIRNVHPVLAAL